MSRLLARMENAVTPSAGACGMVVLAKITTKKTIITP